MKTIIFPFLGGLAFSAYLICITFFACSNFSSGNDNKNDVSPGVSAPGEVFSPVMQGGSGSSAPQIAEWTRTAGPDESMVLTGYNLSRYSGGEEGKDTRFLVYGASGAREASIQRLDGDKAIITLDKSLPRWGMYLVWPGNDAGWGTPIAVNKTEAWWLQDKVAPGMTASVFGRNLAQGNVEGSSNAYVYIKQSGGGSGQWAQVTRVNPYRVDFTVPSSLSAGNYEVWLHNGHGGEYGWSDKLSLTVIPSSQHVLTKSWGTVYNVKSYGAQGNGSSDDRAAINRAVAAAGTSGGVVYFPSGTYMVSGTLNLNNNTKWMGEVDGSGKPNSSIKLMGESFGILRGYNLNLTVFENLKFISNGKKVENYEVVEMRNSQMMLWNNCEVDAKGADAARFQGEGSQHIYLTKTTFYGGISEWGKVMYIDDARQFFIDGCTFKMTNDCGAAIINRGIREASLTNSTIQDLDNSTTDGSGWGKGRIWSSTGGGGSQYHQYFAGNKGIGLGTRITGPNLPDNNSGEILLWEANITKFRGSPASATATTVSFSSAPSNKTPDGVSRALSLFIYEGKGAGQFRKVINQSGGTLTIDKPWGVMPDGSSKMGVGFFTDKIAIYKNSLDANGKAYIANGSRHTASAGVQPYGGCFDFVVDGNTMQGLRRGTTVFSHGTWTDNGLVPNYFHLFVNNKITGCRYGLYSGSLAEQSEGYAMLGQLYRRNSIQQSVISGVQNDVKYAATPIFKAFVYEHNSFGSNPIGFQSGSMYSQDPSTDYGAGALDNQVFYKNSFTGSIAAIRLTPKIALRENNFQSVASPYKGSAPNSATVIEAPYHVLEIKAAPNGAAVKTSFPLWNSGTTAMNWTASATASWLNLEKTSGAINHQGESTSLELTASPKGLAQGNHKTTLTITAGGTTKYYTILLSVEGNKVGGKGKERGPILPEYKKR